jgi:hypothetical protein
MAARALRAPSWTKNIYSDQIVDVHVVEIPLCGLDRKLHAASAGTMSLG